MIRAKKIDLHHFFDFLVQVLPDIADDIPFLAEEWCHTETAKNFGVIGCQVQSSKALPRCTECFFLLDERFLPGEMLTFPTEDLAAFVLQKTRLSRARCDSLLTTLRKAWTSSPEAFRQFVVVESEAVPASPPVARKTNVLVVDDSIDTRDMLALLLSLEGYSVEVTTDRETALKILEQKVPDIILLDWFMPGLSVQEFVRKSRQFGTPQIILMSSGQGLAEKAENVGIQQVLQKPFHPMNILVAINSIAPAK